MDLNSVGKLLATISVHYPSFKKHCDNGEGKISKAFAEEWLRVIGFMDYDEALAKLDQYLKLPEGNKFAPDVKWFLSHKAEKKEEWVNPEFNFDRLDHKGRLIDAEGRMYAFPDKPDELYHYDKNGHIVDSKGVFVK